MLPEIPFSTVYLEQHRSLYASLTLKVEIITSWQIP